MADIKTNLRELSVLLTVGLIKENRAFDLSQLYNDRSFLKLTKHFVGSNSAFKANNILGTDLSLDEYKSIIKNGINLGQAICNHPNFNISNNPSLIWCGYNTQKSDPVDIYIDNYGFSLKENSYILKNMGFYEFLNSMTGFQFKKGLNIYKTYAPQEYEEWFNTTWKFLIEYLTNFNEWNLEQKGKTSIIHLDGDKVIFSFDGNKVILPIDIKTVKEFTELTNSKIREEVFSKWINKVISSDPKYIAKKNAASLKAGAAVSTFINKNNNPNYFKKFFQIHSKEYFYAKTTNKGVEIFKVPSEREFKAEIQFVDCSFSVPKSQINILTRFKNTKNGNQIIFRNECRFSHGQFNGTPEAKLYISRDSNLTDIYEKMG